MGADMPERPGSCPSATSAASTVHNFLPSSQWAHARKHVLGPLIEAQGVGDKDRTQSRVRAINEIPRLTRIDALTDTNWE